MTAFLRGAGGAAVAAILIAIGWHLYEDHRLVDAIRTDIAAARPAASSQQGK